MAETVDTTLLSAETRRELDRLRFEVKRVQPGGRRAERNSRQRGAGIEFVDFRGYSPGDDFRAVDWHAYMRHRKLILKLYEEPQDLPVYVMVDASQSMRESANGEGESKLRFARQIAAAFCYIGLSSEDRVAVLPFAESPLPPMRPLHGRRVVNRMLSYLTNMPGGERTHLKSAIQQLVHRQERRGVVVLISDFMAQDDLEEALSALKQLRHHVALVHVQDPDEAVSLPDGDLLLEDCETGETVNVTISPQARQLYQEAQSLFAQNLEAFCLRQGFPFARADRGTSPAQIVSAIVKQQALRGWGR